MIYQVDFTQQALEDLSLLDPNVARRISLKIQWLCENFHLIIPESLTGPFKGMFKLRIGDWRVLYTVDSKQLRVTIHVVAHRRKVYKT